MGNKINVDKYTFRLAWSEEDACHVARCLEFPSLAAHGGTIEEALREIEHVVRQSIKWLMEDGEPVPEPLGLKKFRGNLTLRVPAEKHRELVLRSAEEGVSVNQFILSKL